jgi:DNA-directed RNA polymerase sigma subunit (sigma70/sigma32)
MAFKRKNKEQLSDAEKAAQEEAFLASADKAPEEITIINKLSPEEEEIARINKLSPEQIENNLLLDERKNAVRQYYTKGKKKGQPIPFDWEYSLDPKAPREYKLMTARFNKHEIGILDELGKIYGVDRMSILRIAYNALAKDKGII